MRRLCCLSFTFKLSLSLSIDPRPDLKANVALLGVELLAAELLLLSRELRLEVDERGRVEAHGCRVPSAAQLRLDAAPRAPASRLLVADWIEPKEQRQSCRPLPVLLHAAAYVGVRAGHALARCTNKRPGRPRARLACASSRLVYCRISCVGTE